MTTTPTLEALLARVEAAEGASRELDADIYEALGWKVKRRREKYHDGNRYRLSRAWSYLDRSRWQPMGFLTASVDAALSLVGRVLPDLQEARLQMGLNGASYCNASLYLDTFTQEPDETFVAPGRTAPLAILSAALRALIAQETEVAHEHA